MATHSSILVWRIPWTQEPDGLQSMELQRVGCDLACMHLSFLNLEGFVTFLTSKMIMATLTQYGGFRHFHIFVSSVCRMKNSPAQRLRAGPTVKLMGETRSTRQAPLRVSVDTQNLKQKGTAPIKCSSPTPMAPFAPISGPFKGCL